MLGGDDMMMFKCRDCSERFVDLETGRTCHATCEKYAAAKDELNAINQKHRREKQKQMDLVGYERDKALRLSKEIE